MFVAEDPTSPPESPDADDFAPPAPAPRREIRCDGCCLAIGTERCPGCGHILCAECQTEHRMKDGACLGRPGVDDGEGME